MNRGRFKSWMRRRFAKRLQHKLDLNTEQLAELMPILGKMRSPGNFFDTGQREQFAELLGAEVLDAEQLNSLIFEKLNRYKQTLDEQALALVAFMSGLDLRQRKTLQAFINKRHRGAGRMCHAR